MTARDPHQPMNPWPATFTCPLCGLTSFNQNDARERWCGNCHGLTEAEPPPGMRWVAFDAKPRGYWRLLDEKFLTPGATYHTFDRDYVLDGEAFVEVT